MVGVFVWVGAAAANVWLTIKIGCIHHVQNHSLPAPLASITMPRRTQALLAAILPSAFAFTQPIHGRTTLLTRLAAEKQAFELMVDLPGGKDLSAKMKFMPALDGPSEIVEVRYQVSQK